MAETYLGMIDEQMDKIISTIMKASLKRHFNKSEEHIRKVHVYKDTALNAMQDASEFDTTIVELNDGCMEKLREAAGGT